MHYSAFGRVDEITHEGANVYENYRYEFDVYGNKIGTENVTNYVYNINNQLLSETDAFTSKSYTYDRRGNLLDMKSKDEVLKAFTFDATNRMTASMGIVDGVQKNATYAYNGLGHRMEQNVYTGILPENPEKKIQYTIDMTRQYYNLLQTNSGEENAQTYYWDGNVAGMESFGEERYYLQDDLGSPMQLLNADGMSCEIFAYDEFGLGLVDQTRTSQMFGFTGYQMDEVGGLYFAQARRYDAQNGRFVSEDKVRGVIIVPYTMNHYVYCWNDPEDYEDNDGNLPTVVVGALIGAGVGFVGSIVADVAAGREVDFKKAGLTAVGGAVAGALIGTGAGAAAGMKVAASTVVTGAAVGAVSSGGMEVVAQIAEDKIAGEPVSINWNKVSLETIKGGVTGGFAATGLGTPIIAATYAGVDMGGDVIEQTTIKNSENYSLSETVSKGIWSFGTTFFAGFADDCMKLMKDKPDLKGMDYIKGRNGAIATIEDQLTRAKKPERIAELNRKLAIAKNNRNKEWFRYLGNEVMQSGKDVVYDELFMNEIEKETADIFSGRTCNCGTE